MKRPAKCAGISIKRTGTLCVRCEQLLHAAPKAVCEAVELIGKTLWEPGSVCVIGAKEQFATCALNKNLLL